jgi:hypothetical protein
MEKDLKLYLFFNDNALFDPDNAAEIFAETEDEARQILMEHFNEKPWSEGWKLVAISEVKKGFCSAIEPDSWKGEFYEKD